MINKVLTEEEMFEERLRRLDKQEYLDEKEHRFILANIKACFKEALHQREYIKQLERVMTKQQDLLEILKKCEDEKHSLYCVYVLNALSSGKITQDDTIKVKEWLDNE